MKAEFDKEIDVLLRQAGRRGETVSDIAASHLDADEINAFAEQVLPEKARVRAIEHLADCARCRNILSNLIDFNTEPASEIFPVSVAKTVFVPWYKRLFVFPQIAYAMTLAVLIFAGIIAAVVLKNSMQNTSSEIARIDEKTQTANPVSSAANTNSASSNAALSANSGAARNKNSAPAKPAPKSAAPSSESKTPKKEKTEVVAGAPPRDNNYTVDGDDSVSARKQNEVPQSSVSPNQNSDMPKTAPDTRSVQSLPMNGRSMPSMQVMKNRAEAKADSASDAKDKATETRSVGGKNFRRTDGAWYDVKYKGQKTINVSRSSSDYKKLNGNLRSIADNLGGAVVIVWKDKAYRIQ